MVSGRLGPGAGGGGWGISEQWGRSFSGGGCPGSGDVVTVVPCCDHVPRSTGSRAARRKALQGPAETSPQPHSHDGLADVQKRLLDKFPDAVHLPRGYDEVFGLVTLQHQPHGLQRERQEGVRRRPAASGKRRPQHPSQGTRHREASGSVRAHVVPAGQLETRGVGARRGQAPTERNRLVMIRVRSCLIRRPGRLLVNFPLLGSRAATLPQSPASGPVWGPQSGPWPGLCPQVPCGDGSEPLASLGPSWPSATSPAELALQLPTPCASARVLSRAHTHTHTHARVHMHTHAHVHAHTCRHTHVSGFLQSTLKVFQEKLNYPLSRISI